MRNVTLFPNLLINVVVLLAIGSSLSSGQATPKNVICYFDSNNYWDPLYPYVKYTVSDMDASLCTHVVYYYTTMDEDKLTLSDTFRMVHNLSSVWKEFVNLRLANPSLKVILSVQDYRFYIEAIDLGLSDDYRQTLINNVVEFLRHWDFDGLDYWMYTELTQPFANLLEEMHAAFEAEATSSGRDPLILMLTAYEFLPMFGEGVDVQGLAEASDIFHVQTHHLGDRNDKHTKLSTPLYGNWINYKKHGNVSHIISSVLDAGVPSEKVHMTIQFSAVTFMLSDPELTGVGAPSMYPGFPGDYTGRVGALTYYEVCKRLQEEGYTAEFDPEGLVNFAYKGDQWMTYEDPASIEIKMNYVYEHNLGGVTAWYLREDDYTGQFCNQGRYPLLSTLYNYRPGCPDGQVFDSSKGYCVEKTICRIISLPNSEL